MLLVCCVVGVRKIVKLSSSQYYSIFKEVARETKAISIFGTLATALTVS